MAWQRYAVMGRHSQERFCFWQIGDHPPRWDVIEVRSPYVGRDRHSKVDVRFLERLDAGEVEAIRHPEGCDHGRKGKCVPQSRPFSLDR